MNWNEFLHDAVAEKDAEMVRQALGQGADPNHSDGEAGSAFFGMTELHWAVFGGSLDIARLLLDAGAQVKVEQDASSSSLHAAAHDANLPMVNLLLQYDGAAALN